MGKVRIGCKKEKYFYVRNPVKSLVDRITETNNLLFIILHINIIDAIKCFLFYND